MARDAKRGFLLLLAAAGAAALAWLLLDPAGTGAGPLAPAGATREAGGRAEADADADPAPDAPAGTGAIAGRVRRGTAPATARIEVRARDEPDRVDERLDALLAPGAPVAVADAGADGGFVVPDLPPGRYEVRALADGLPAVVAFAEIEVPRQTARVEIDLPAGDLVLRGRAVHADGRPFRGEIRIGHDPEDLAVPAGADGAFVFGGLEPGRVTLFAAEPGASYREGPTIRIPHEGQVRFVVGEGDVPLAVRVLAAADGAPIAGAVVTGVARGAIARATTDTEGRSWLRLPAEDRTVAVDAPGYAHAWLGVPDGREEVLFRLAPAARVTGRVVAEEDGRPLAGVGVRMIEAWFGTPVGATTDAEGRFVFASAPTGRFRLEVRGGGWRTPDTGRPPPEYRVAPGESLEVELRAARAARIEGRLLDGAGEPVPGATVRSGPADDWWSLTDVAVTDGAGRFVLENVPARTPWRVVAGEGLARTSAEPFVGAPGETIPVELRLPAMRRVTVRVVESGSDRPLADASVRLDGAAGRREAARTSVEGTAVVETPATGGSISVSHADALTNIDYEWGAGGPPEEIELALELGESIAGVVLTPDGTPAAAAAAVRVEDPGWHATIRSEPDGTFRIRGLPPGRHTLRVEDGDRSVTVEADAGTSDLRIELPAAPPEFPPLRLRVVDPEGAPVAWASVDVMDPSGRRVGHSWIQDGEGRVPLSDAPRTVAIEITGAESCHEAPLPCAPTRVVRTVAPDEVVEIRMEPGRTISGRVVDADGRGVAGVRIDAQPEGGPFGDDSTETNSAPDGRFLLEGLAEGEHRVEVRIEWDGPRVARTVAAGAADVELRLPPRRESRVTVVDERGAPIRGAGVLADWKEEQGYAEATTDQHGIAVLRGVPREPISEIRVRPPDPGIDFSAEGWNGEDRTVTIATGLFVTGRVVASARPSAGLRVLWSTGGEEWSRVTPADDGTFRIGPVPPGPVRLVATDGDSYEPGWRAPVTVVAGASEVRLDFAPGWTLEVAVPGLAPRTNGWRYDVRLTDAATGATEMRDARKTDDPVLAVEGLTPGHRFHLYAHVGDDRYVLARDLSPARPRARAEIRTGASLVIHAVWPAGAKSHEVTISGDGWWTAAVELGRGRSWRAHALPPPPWRVTARCRVGDARIEKTVDGVASEEVTIDLRE